MTTTKPITMQPLHDQVLVRRMKDDELTTGGLFIPETARSIGGTPRGRGVVVAVGLGRKSPVNGERIPMTVAIGDEIFCSRLSGDVLDEATKRTIMAELSGAGGEDYFLIAESELMVIVDKEKT